MNLLRRRSNEPNRRQFLLQTGCASMGITGMVNTLAHLRLMQGSLNAQSSSAPGYKALVCLFLQGGNDSNNLLIPASGAARTDYQNGRGVLAVPVADLQNITPANLTASDPLGGGYLGNFGLNPQAAELAALFNAGELGFITNAGTLTQPGITRANYNTASRPPQLFSHSDQQVQWQSSVPDRPFTSGWGGRIAGLLDPALNTGSNRASMSISIAGVNSFQTSATGITSPYVLGAGGVTSLTGYGANYANAVFNPQVLFQSSNYRNNERGRRLQAFEQSALLSQSVLLEDAYRGVLVNARQAEGQVGTALSATEAGAGTTLDTIFENAFAGSGLNANNTFTQQLKLVARLIAGRSSLGNNRQIFFVQQGGYDTHVSQIPGVNPETTGHTGLINTLSRSLKAFSDALKFLGVWDNVVTFSASDFTRTFTPNRSDNTAGSDHAWGGHTLVLGGPVQGGRLYGKFPVLKVGDAANSIDSTGNRGRWIPSTAVDQYAAVLARWFGVEPAQMPLLFPNLSRFDNPFTSSAANLGFLPPV